MPELSSPNFQNDAQAVAAVVERLANASLVQFTDEKEVLVVPTGMRIESVKRLLDEYRTRPERRQGTVTIETLDAFIDFVNVFKDTTLTTIFAAAGDSDPEDDGPTSAPSLTAVFDYHPQHGNVDDARFGGWRARYQFPLSEEWLAWREKNDATLSHGLFAAFLEDRIQDVIDVNETDNGALWTIRSAARRLGGKYASPTELMTLSRGLQLSVVGNVKSARTLSSGEISLQFEESHVGSDNKPLQIPSLFALSIPVFQDDAPYNIACRLRYRVDAGKILWWYTMHRPEKYFDDAFKVAVKKVDDATGLQLFRGTPEK